MSDSDDHCVWMTAGVLSYWLCPRSFDCERCVLDRILSGRSPDLAAESGSETCLHTGSGALELLGVPIRRRPGLWYHPIHVWARSVGPGRVRLGLDDIAARLLADAEPWSLPRTGQGLRTRDPLSQTRLGDRAVRVASPLPGRVMARNMRVTRHPRLVTWSPYGAGWLVELNTDLKLGALAGFMRDEAVVARWFDREVERLSACALVPDDGVGVTMADGGATRAGLAEVLGADGVDKALETFFPFGGDA